MAMSDFGVPVLSSSGALIVPLPERYRFTAAPTLRAPDGCTLIRKPELHITLLNAAKVARICDGMSKHELQKLAQGAGHDIRRGGDGAVMHDRQRRRWSLVEWVEMPGFDVFRQRAGDSAGVRLPETRPHITHFATDSRGIGLPDLDRIAELKAFDLRLPGISPRHPDTTADEVRADFRGLHAAGSRRGCADRRTPSGS